MLVISNLAVAGPAYSAAALLEEQGHDVEHAVRRMLDIGGAVLEHGTNRATVDALVGQVDRLLAAVGDVASDQLPKVLSQHEKQIEGVFLRHFDPKGTESVQQQFTQIVRKLAREHQREMSRAMLDEAGPLGILRAEVGAKMSALVAQNERLASELSALQAKAAAEQATEAERRRGTAKGGDFEAVVFDIVEDVHSRHEDVVVAAGTTSGSAGGKVGDVVVSLNPDDTFGREVKTVVEAKCRALSLPASLKELDRAMENREAAAGVLVFSNQAISPLKDRSFRVYPGNRIIVVLDDETRDPLALEVACNVARTWALRAVHTVREGVDSAAIGKCVDRLVQIVEEAKGISRGVNAARRGIDQVDRAYAELRTNALTTLAELDEQLRGEM